MQQSRALRERLLSYSQQRARDAQTPALDLSGADLTRADLRGLDLSGVNLTGATLSRAKLEGARLQQAEIGGASFVGVRIGTLLAAGLPSQTVLQQRAAADRSRYRPLHFSAAPSPLAPLLVTAGECVQVCLAFYTTCWEHLTDEAVFTVLYPDETWDDWMARCRSRLILTWAVEYRTTLDRYATAVPFYGRVLPSTLIDEVEETDLVAGVNTRPQRVLHALGLRQLLTQRDLPGTDVAYPRSPFGDVPGIVQITSRRQLQLEAALMHQGVVGYDHACLSRQSFIYHLRPAAPQGSTLELYPDGTVGQHRAIRNRAPSPAERQQVAQWLTSLGLASQFGSMMERLRARLQPTEVVRVCFQVYRYADEDTVDDVVAYDQEGKRVLLQTVSDEDVWTLVHEEYGSPYGQWELDVAAQRLTWVGEACPREDEWDDEEEDV